MLIFYSGSDNHVKVVAETVLTAPKIMLTYWELRRHPHGNSRFRRWCKNRANLPKQHPPPARG